MFNRNTMTMYGIFSKLPINTPERQRLQCLCSVFVIDNFEQISLISLMFPLLTFNIYKYIYIAAWTRLVF